MRSRIFLLVLVFLVFSLQAYAKEFEIIQITDGTQKFRNPVWSPDGTMLAFWGPSGIYVARADGTELPRKIFETFGEFLIWVSDSELVYWQRKFIEVRVGEKSKKERRESLRVVNLNGQERIIEEGSRASAPHRLKDGSITYKRDGEYYDIIKHQKLNPETLKKELTITSHYPPSYDPVTKRPKYDDTDIWVTSLDGSFEKRITYGKRYYLPQLSPDGTKISTSDGVVIYILDFNGNILANLGRGDWETWSPASNQIAFVTAIDDGYNIISSDLFVFDLNKSLKFQITNTTDEIEVEPQWSPNGDKIVFFSENSGKIFVVEFNQNIK